MRKMNNAASSNQAMNGAAVARKAPTTQSFQGEQRQENAPQGVASDQPLNLADVDPTHSGQEGRPLAELNRHHLESSATRWQVAQPTATPRSALIGVVATQ
jgi:hypothetical protein